MYPFDLLVLLSNEFSMSRRLGVNGIGNNFVMAFGLLIKNDAKNHCLININLIISKFGE